MINEDYPHEFNVHSYRIYKSPSILTYWDFSNRAWREKIF